MDGSRIETGSNPPWDAPGRQLRIDPTRRNRQGRSPELGNGTGLRNLRAVVAVAFLIRASRASLECTLGSNTLGYKYERKEFYTV